MFWLLRVGGSIFDAILYFLLSRLFFSIHVPEHILAQPSETARFGILSWGIEVT